MKRNKHSLSHYNLFTGNMGSLIPISCYEVLPGDTVQQSSSVLLRVSPLVAPVMHPVTVRIHHWFVPHRLVWDGWEDFITGGPDGMGGSAGAFPTLTSPAGGFGEGSLADYLGIPAAAGDLNVSALPFRSYNKIWNENYRDQDLQGEAGDDDTALLPVSWEKDYFTAARPWTQKGPEVILPLGDRAPVKGIGANEGISFSTGPQNAKETGGLTRPYQYFANVKGDAATDTFYVEGNGSGTSGFPNIYADLVQATGASVNDVRLAFALQRYEEARARYGSRYTEYLRYLGVKSSDARLQRPEYLGGGKQTISFSEVLQTAPGTTDGAPAGADTGVGTMAGHGIAGMRTARFRRFFEEHGIVLSLLSVRPRGMYMDSLNKLWSRRTKEDYYQRELEFIGQQEIRNREIFATSDANGGNEVFGYADRYAEYKQIPSRVSSEFRSILNYWHMARGFASTPVLNASFVACDPTRRIYQSTNTDNLWCMANHSIQARRMVRKGNNSKIY